MMENKNVTTLAAGTGTYISMVGDTYRILISGKETNGAYAVIDMMIPPGGGPGPHAHKNIAEMFYVANGTIDFETEAGTFNATTGAFVNVPFGGAVHSFKNNSHAVAHLICTVMPAGLEAMFEELGKPVEAGKFLPPQKMEEAELKRFTTIAEKYGQQLFPPDYFEKKRAS
jgi:quercetin dioxygenase-like cupin family protein